ncbi:murein L,D-transpeptidase [Snodgrassella sp. ESL0323]|nr:murein L,D-transpeptidase [Snodgrassella alvi]NUF78437.1 murein L,D-transpeptidase [Snodgrassella sp. ESL0323]
MTICMIVIGFAGIVAGVSLFFRNYPVDQKIKTINVKNTAVTVSPPVSGDKIYLRIFKQEGILEIWYKHKNNNYQLYRTWDICTYSGGLGPKKAEGDGKSPEGFYATEKNLLKPNSNYHLAFNIGYPNAYDRANGYTGSFIMIHGNCVSIGCYAMTDKGIEQIYAVVNQAINSGQKRIPIHIFPFRMTASNMQKFQKSAYMPFWSELKPAYDIFQSEHRVADITVHNKHYVIK